ncbi:MAG TPA: hypothetical protein VJ903_05820 [Clostridia bacterium]|nr:hypothetical protein [Clostridia bacterium]
MYICEECGDTRSELKEEYEHIGGFQSGKQGYTYTDDDCSCGGTYVEAVKCKECGEWASELYSGFCDDCLKGEARISNAIHYGDSKKEPININGFYLKVFGVAQINSILQNAFFETTTEGERITNANEFCLKDKEEFSEFLTNS